MHISHGFSSFSDTLQDILEGEEEETVNLVSPPAVSRVVDSSFKRPSTPAPRAKKTGSNESPKASNESVRRFYKKKGKKTPQKKQEPKEKEKEKEDPSKITVQVDLHTTERPALQ